MKRLIALLLCLAAVVGVVIVKDSSTDRQSSQHDRQNVPTLPRANPRTVYPYSVVAGGVQSVAEVKAAIHDDPTIAAHYASINFAKLKPIKQVGDIRRYVSYRMNGSISWTSKLVTIKDGELLLTDGSTTLRGRCGNLLSDTPQQPTQASTSEPRVEELDKPLPLEYISQLKSADPSLTPAGSAISDPVSPALSWTPGRDAWSPTLPLQPGPSMPSIIGDSISSASTSAQSGPSQSSSSVPFIPGTNGPPLIFPSAPGGSGAAPPPNPLAKGPVDIASTPEPSTLMMIGLGLAGMLLLERIRANRRNNA